MSSLAMDTNPKQTHSVVANIKYEPTEEWEKSVFKILDVQSIQENIAVPQAKHYETDPEDREPEITMMEITSDVQKEDTTERGRYCMRKRTVQSYNEELQNESEKRKTFKKKSSKSSKMNKSHDNDKVAGQVSNFHKNKPIIENPKTITCEICSTVFFTTESLEQHVIDVHVVDKEFQCKQCTKTFINQQSLDSHKAEHKKEKQLEKFDKCPICSKVFTAQNYLRKHILTHEAVRPFPCKLCPSSYVKESDLKYHESSQHGKGQKFACPKCGKTFSRKYVMKDHVRTHSNAKNIKCERCSAAFKTKQSLRQHRLYCKAIGEGKASKSKSKKLEESRGPKKRCRAAFKFLTQEQKKDMFNFQYKQHRCSECGYTCTSFSSLKSHMVSHSDERNHVCKLCSAAFKRSQDLKLHVLKVPCVKHKE